jgi:peptidoglycan/LPS O-acetylase OafA/YrhL
MTPQRYAVLDGLRAIAAMAVLLLHLERPGFHMPQAAYTAVDLFFLISGFVVADAYEGRIARFGVLAFLRARVIRLYPMLLAGLLILPAYCLVAFVRHGTSPATAWQILGSMAASLAMIPSHLPPSRLWHKDLLFPLDGPVWSLMLEMIVNLAYAAFLPWLSRRVLVVVVVTAGSVLVASQIALGGVDLGWGWPTAWGGLPRATFSFFLGVLIFRLKIPRPTLHPVLILAAAMLLFCAPPLATVLIGYPLVLIAATKPDRRGAAAMAAMGALSYPVYVIHFPLLHWIGWLLAGQAPAWASIPISVAIVLLCATAALKLWDEPARRWLSRRAPPGWSTGAAARS